MYKIAAIVVTYNSKDCLLECLDAIEQQTLPPDVVYVVDNHSTDGTFEILSDKKSEKIDIRYIYKQKNSGGAGGFYAGMKTAFDDGYEWFWMMDDDGLPAHDGLEQLYLNTSKNNLYFTNAIVINREDRKTLSFGPILENKNTLSDYNGQLVHGIINPFNGTFINRIVPEKIGFVKKEMFIYGDELEYMFRAQKNKFSIVTIASSIHYHPAEKAKIVYAIPFIKKEPIKIRSAQFTYIQYRNMGYLYSLYGINYKQFLAHVFYFIFRLRFVDCVKFLKAFLRGYRNEF